MIDYDEIARFLMMKVRGVPDRGLPGEVTEAISNYRKADDEETMHQAKRRLRELAFMFSDSPAWNSEWLP